MRLHHEGERVTLYHGDCLEVLRSLPDASVDSVVTDPPYGLEFMGKDWDAPWRQAAGSWADRDPAEHARPELRGQTASPFLAAKVNKFAAGLPFQQWCELWTAECLRVLKPGGHMLSFGGTRTWHRLACAVEDAGFEVRDSIAWLYGCHDDRTEVLTRRGWVNGLDLTEDDDVAQWATDGTISLVRPTARQRYEYDGPLVRFRNADVDQLVTPNHRVYRQVVERRQVAGKRTATWSDWRVDQAADVNRWQPMRLPAAGVHDGPGIGGTDYASLLGWVWSDGGFDNTGTGVRVYQSSSNQPFVDEIAALLDRLGAHKRYDYQRKWKGREYTSTTWFITGDLANRVRADLPGKSPTFDLLWRMTADEKRALWDAAMKGDGSKAQRAFWQQNRADLEWAQALLAGIECRGKISDDPRGVMHWTDRPTVGLQRRHLATAPVPYLGEVWCVTVPSGAFIVRRNGRVSVSGNSGFPKSLDVSKAIDKRGGADIGWFGPWLREERRRRGISSNQLAKHFPSRTGGETGCVRNWELSLNLPTPEQFNTLCRVLDLPFAEIAEAEREVIGKHRAGLHTGTSGVGAGGIAGAITAPASDAAERWQGWGTALKPAFEPVVVARKPLSGTVAANVLAHGTGALNIDATRVEAPDDRKPVTGFKNKSFKNRTSQANDRPWMDERDPEASAAVQPHAAGRWPANVLLDDSQAAELDRQSGESSSTQRTGKRTGKRTGTYGDFAGQDDVEMGHNDTGGASRFFPTFRYEAKAPSSERPRIDGVAHPTVKPLTLMSWLVRLVTPPGGTVLEPFAGSGTTVEAAIVEGFHCIAIEREADYLPLIMQRVNRRLDPVAAIKQTGDDLGLFDLEGEGA